MENIISNDIVTGEVFSIHKTHVLVKLENGYMGLLHVSNVSDYYIANIGRMFDVGSEYTFHVLKWNHEENKAMLSWKTIMPRFQKNPFAFDIKETQNGIVSLKKKLEKELEND